MDFLEPTVEGLLDPFLMKDMRQAADRIERAVREGERIRVYGDYDADGVTSTALMIRLLTELGATFDTYIPHRSREGYGLNNEALDRAAEAGVGLLITVDNGISAVGQIAYATEIGIDVVVTDHHEPPETLPRAVALVNPKQKDCPYPFKGLCGAGVAFKLAHALLGRPVLEYADLAAIGTIADLMPLTGENRIIARLGLESMRSRPVAGVRALARVAGFEAADLSSGRIGFSLAPRLNAGGRLAHADSAVQLLTAVSEEAADVYALELDHLNQERQALVEQTFAEADGIWQSLLERKEAGRVIVLAKEGWNAGIAGLVASKLVEKYYQPAFVLAIDSQTQLCKGSGRSIEGFDLYAALKDCEDLMEHYGGHQAAAGLTLHRDKVTLLAERLDRLAEQRLKEEDWQPKRRVDLCVTLGDATLGAVEQLSRLEPFGNGNPAPRIALRDVTIRDSRTMGKENQHLKFTIEQSGQSIDVVAFGMGAQRERLAPGLRIDLLGELSVNEWNGNRKVQMMFQDLRSEQLAVADRRGERSPWAAMERIAAVSSGTELLIGCASQSGLEEALARFGDSGARIGLYHSPGPERGVPDEETRKETAAAMESGGAAQHLVLLGLPSTESEIVALRRWLAPERGLERVTVLDDPSSSSRRSTEKGNGAFPERKQFAEVYALCRKKGQWLEGPDGFLQETAQTTGLPLAVVRMMHEVFIELGFIDSRGASRKVVSDPPKRPLDESPRYRRAKELNEERRLAEMSAEQLQLWMNGCHSRV
jgi:single-stranded-DNA-specific exonuclease